MTNKEIDAMVQEAKSKGDYIFASFLSFYQAAKAIRVEVKLVDFVSAFVEKELSYQEWMMDGGK